MVFLFPLLLILADDKALTPIEPAKLDRKEPVDFGKEIQPLFAKKCLSCHSGAEAKGGYSMTMPEAILSGGKKAGKGVVPGAPRASALYKLASHEMKPVMPPRSENDDLTPEELALVKLWIEQGAKMPADARKVERAVKLSVPPALVKPVRALAIHANSLAVARSNQVRLLDSKTGEILATLIDPKLADTTHVSLVESLAFSPDGKKLATGSFREVTVWDLEKRTIHARIRGFADKVTAVTWHPNGELLAVAGGTPTEDGEVKLFNNAGNLVTEIKSPHSDTVFGVAFNPEGTMLATAGADKFVKVFDLGGKLLKSFEGHTQHVLDVGWSPDGKRIVSAGADDLIKIWDCEKGEKTRDLRGTVKQVQRLGFAGKTPNFFSAGGDGIVRRWNVETGDPSRTFDGAKDSLSAVAANADGTLIAAGGEEGIVRIYDAKNGQLLKTVDFSTK